MEKKRVGIMGGAGYAGGELVRLLTHHDQTNLIFVQSRSQVGKAVSAVHTDLLGETDLVFTTASSEAIAELDVLFLALGHGETKPLLSEGRIPLDVKVIDLSADLRLHSQANFEGRKFVYGLPEAFREEIKHAQNIANPGCFATAIQGSLLPLAKAGILKQAFVTGVTGSTGAGISPSGTTHFSFRSSNVQAYKTLSHQHVAEIEETLHSFPKAKEASVSFVPWRGGFTRGIFVSSIVESALSKEEALKLYRDYYEGHPFVTVTGDAIDLKSVVNTNKMNIEINQDGKNLAIHVALDNLLKGASGQAVQNYNLMCGFPETTGLRLKGVVF
jgi:N-acetyl-gamma-glutamyl-phosphate reductase